ncbi:hypothetical protein SADUNF_Sadunf02G0058600 [Salix dunnii]|uniref:Uncharacterized protein n=1 Tax=Salix dunnii TaxID=1413687 RepID=A0A835N6J4_9ROSI|nr:hypothetical protein SADUNF_Sadunf02G0058600 [Salix dunnii]
MGRSHLVLVLCLLLLAPFVRTTYGSRQTKMFKMIEPNSQNSSPSTFTGFFPKGMPIPPSGPSKKHYDIELLRHSRIIDLVEFQYFVTPSFVTVPQSDHRDVLFEPCSVLHYISTAQLDHRDVLLDYVSLFYSTLKEDEDVFSYELRKFASLKLT